MKKVLTILFGIIVALCTISCSQYTCPAYGNKEGKRDHYHGVSTVNPMKSKSLK